MARRKIKLITKVKIMRENLRLLDAKAISRKYGVSERTAYNWYQRVLIVLKGATTTLQHLRPKWH